MVIVLKNRKKQNKTSVGEKLEPLRCTGGNVKWYSHWGKQ